jgi:tetratricopeptide (TPR) repeat protein
LENTFGQRNATWRIHSNDLEWGNFGIAISQLKGLIEKFGRSDDITSAALPYLIKGYIGVGDYETALRWLNEYQPQNEKLGFLFRIPLLSISVVLYCITGDTDRAVEILKEMEMDLPNEVILKLPFNVQNYLAKIEVHLALREFDKAVEIGEEAITALDVYGQKLWFCEIAHALGKGYLGQSPQNKEMAENILRRGVEVAEESNIRPMLWQLLLALTRLTDNPEVISDYKERAWETILYIEKHVGSEAHRRSFLSHPVIVRAYPDQFTPK